MRRARYRVNFFTLAQPHAFPVRRTGMLLRTLAASIAALAVLPASAGAVAVGQSGWSWGAPRPQGNDLDAVAFAGARGYAVGRFGTILRSDDGGSSWATVPTGLTAGMSVIAVTGESSFVAGGGCVLRSSDDGGRTLARLRFVPRETRCSAGLTAISFPSRDAGVLALSDGTVLRTDDGGRTLARRAGVPGVYDIAFASADTGYAVTSAGALLRTTDGAKTWTALISAGPGLRAVTIAPGGAVLAAGYDATLLRTRDGVNVERLPLAGAPYRDYAAIACATAGRCLLAGTGGGLTLTTDGGDTGAGVREVDDVHALAWPDADHAVGVGALGLTVLSANGGVTFTRAGDELAGRYSKVRATSATLAATAGRDGAFAISADGGATWTEGAVSTTAELVDVSFPAAASGFALDNEGTLYRTENAGASWRILDTGASGRPVAVLATTSARVYVAGPRGVRVSTNGGEAFDPVGPGAMRDAAITQLDRDGRTLLAYGPRAIFLSADGGRAWHALRRPSRHTDVDTADFVSPRIGWVLDDAGRVFATRNAGRRWRAVQWGGAPVEGLSFADAEHGWLQLAGFPRTTTDGWLLRSGDGGRSWRPQLVSAQLVGAGVAGTRTLVATGPATGIVLSPGHRESFEEDYGGDTTTILTGPQALYSTSSGGAAGKRARLTLRGPRKVRRGRRATLRGALTPVRGGEAITLWERRAGASRWRRIVVHAGSKGGFSVRVKILARTQFIAQWEGDEQRSSAGTRPVAVRAG